MSAPVAPTLPKPPAERTFVAAVFLLSALAVVEVIATVVALAPRLNIEAIGRAVAPSKTAEVPAASAEVAMQADKLLAEAGDFRKNGNFQGAIEAVREADLLMPNKPGILLALASDHMSLGQQAEAVSVLQRIVALPPSQDPVDQRYLAQAQAALAQLGAAPATGAPAAAATTSKGTDTMRDDVGIPIGCVLGITATKFTDGEPGKKVLQVATKASPSVKIDPAQLKIVVYFYEQNDRGDVQLTDSRVASDWLSYPVDWTGGNPELLQVTYPLPATDRGDLPPLQYYGYVVGVYYKGELQDQRAEPVALLDQFPLKLNVSDNL